MQRSKVRQKRPKLIFAQAKKSVVTRLWAGKINDFCLTIEMPNEIVSIVPPSQITTMSLPILFCKRQQRVALSAVEKRKLAEFSLSQPARSGMADDQQLLSIVQQHPLSFASIADSLQALSTEQVISSLLIENLPIDPELPAPPRDGIRPRGKSACSESAALQLINACRLKPFSYKEENEKLIHEITPVAGHDRQVSSAGIAALGFHTDLAILRAPYQPEFLALAGLRNDAATPTLIADLDDILAAIRARSAQLIAPLREPRFRLESPPLLRLWGGKSLRSEPRPLLTAGDLGRETIAANFNSLTALDPEAERALLAIQEVLPEVSRELVIGPGELLLLNNQRCLHGRAAIPQRGQRWLQRTYSRRCLEHLRRATASGPEAVVFGISQLILE